MIIDSAVLDDLTARAKASPRLRMNLVSYVLGPRQSLTSEDMHSRFGIFLYNMEVRRLDPVVACEKIKLATEQCFSCYDRQEEELNRELYAYDGFSEGFFLKVQ